MSKMILLLIVAFVSLTYSQPTIYPTKDDTTLSIGDTLWWYSPGGEAFTKFELEIAKRGTQDTLRRYSIIDSFYTLNSISIFAPGDTFSWWVIGSFTNSYGATIYQTSHHYLFIMARPSAIKTIPRAMPQVTRISRDARTFDVLGRTISSSARGLRIVDSRLSVNVR